MDYQHDEGDPWSQTVFWLRATETRVKSVCSSGDATSHKGPFLAAVDLIYRQHGATHAKLKTSLSRSSRSRGIVTGFAFPRLNRERKRCSDSAGCCVRELSEDLSLTSSGLYPLCLGHVLSTPGHKTNSQCLPAQSETIRDQIISGTTSAASLLTWGEVHLQQFLRADFLFLANEQKTTAGSFTSSNRLLWKMLCLCASCWPRPGPAGVTELRTRGFRWLSKCLLRL